MLHSDAIMMAAQEQDYISLTLKFFSVHSTVLPILHILIPLALLIWKFQSILGSKANITHLCCVPLRYI